MEIASLTAPDIRQRIWVELQRATQDRHHEWRTPVLATTGADGLPNARTVVLRHANAKLGSLQMYTDSRSPKVAELLARPQVMLVFWSRRLSWQLRVRAATQVQHAGPEVDAVWARVSQSAAAGDYLSTSAPGDVLPTHNTANSPTPTLSPHHNLAIVTAHIEEMDWLELARSGHRRAVLSADQWTWRVP